MSMVVVFLLSLALALPTSAQIKRISLSMNNVSVQEAITAINRNANYSIVVNSDVVDLKKRVTVSAEDATIQEVLKQVFNGQNVYFVFEGNRVTVSPQKKVPSQATHLIPVKKYQGKVVDNQNNPLIGAIITVNNQVNSSVTSDLYGNFEISDMDFPSKIKATYLGFNDIQVSVRSEDSFPLTIVMTENVSLLQDVVVIGYATMKKRDLVGAVEQVDSKVVGDRAAGNLSRALQGEVTGLNISFNDGKPSRSASINVRGITSIGAGGSTLILIDGVEGGLESINPQDVESVSVLKDASSTAVYGARGAFGVILVTTKSPKKGVPVVNYNASIAVNRRTVIPDGVTDSKTWLDWWIKCYNGYYNGTKSILNHIDSTVPYSDEIYAELQRRNGDTSLSKVATLYGHPTFGWAYYANTDWYDLLYKDYNLSTEHNISISGGNSNADYYVSGRYYDMDGIYKVGDEYYNKYDLRAKGSLKIRPWFKITNNMSFSLVNHKQPMHQDGSNIEKLMNHCAYPLSTVKNPDGTWTAAAAKSGFAAFSEGTSWLKDNYVYLRDKIDGDVDIIKDILKIQGDYSFNYTTRKRLQATSPVQYSKIQNQILVASESNPSSLSQTDYSTKYQAANAYLTWTSELGDNHSFKALAGWNVESNHYETLNVSRMGFVTTNKPSFSLMNGIATDPSAGGYDWSYLGAFFRLNYSYNGKYLVEASGRYDGSSKFPEESKWGFFPSASIAWRLSDEPWMLWSKNVMNEAKIRVSAGSMGNGNVSPYSYTSTMTIATADDTVLGGVLPSYTSVGSVVPSSLTWETSTTYDGGIDLDFFQSKLSFTGDYYIRYTTDMYTPSVSLPSVYGTTPPKGNNAELRTNGWETSLMWRDQLNLFGKPFSYSIKAMLWDNYSTITKYVNDSGSLGTVKAYLQNGGTPSNYYVGMRVGEIWGYKIAGLFKDQDDINSSAIHNFQQASDKVTRPGQVKVADLDKSGYIDAGSFTLDNHGDLIIIGNQNPRYRYGLNLSANWNGIGFSMFIQGVGKQDWYPGPDAGMFWGKYGRPFFAFLPSIHVNSNDVYDESKDNWSTAYWPRVSTYQSNGTNNWTKILEIPNTRYIQNASYLRVKTMQLDYSFNEKVCKPLKLQGLKVYLTGENLLTFTPLHKYAPNYDPEALSYDADFSSAADGYTYPVFKNLSLGINITF
jgi:TonB-linked SusC/RagA family outer membrane protein